MHRAHCNIGLWEQPFNAISLDLPLLVTESQEDEADGLVAEEDAQRVDTRPRLARHRGRRMFVQNEYVLLMSRELARDESGTRSPLLLAKVEPYPNLIIGVLAAPRVGTPTELPLPSRARFSASAEFGSAATAAKKIGAAFFQLIVLAPN